ncbi:rab-like protein 6 isoform X3 [Gopherus flavomarginatus]|uniref:rab-like protein 6 isoform X3 n=1 Tax=Gopherus flavomarginatus TaxID=286002 RepID=UPI0021CBC034|nr:rab-like protein 6 isoform X3 [Gopherus flavomarginatus]
MFSALKKLVGSDQAPVRDKNIPAGLQSMNQALQRRFAKGVQYNTTDDIVKVEVWDVVDKGKCKKRGDGLKLENDPQEAESEMALDAEFLDVYKNCNGVVMMFDITKQWTFNYILRELPKVPTHVPVCVLGNYRDMGEHRVILPDDMRAFIDNLNRPPGSSYFRYAESSMKNSFGLKYLHKFFNIPFLQLQVPASWKSLPLVGSLIRERETLLRQLETNQLDIDATLEELSVQQETEDQNYEIFLEMMEARSRGHASPMATNGQSPSSGSQSPIVPPSCTSTDSSSPGTPQPPPPPQQLPANATSPEPPSSLSPVPPLEAQLPHTSSPAAPATPVVVPLQKRSIISRLFGTSPAPEMSPPPPDAATVLPSEVPAKVQSVEDFIPDDSLDHSFLEDTIPQRDKGITKTKDHNESDSDGEALGGNPMVAGFQDDLDLDDKVPSKPSLAAELVPSKNITLSSEEEAEMEDAMVTIVADEDIDVDYETQWSSKNSVKPQKKASSTKAPDQKPPGSLPPHSGFEKHISTKLPTDLPATGAAAPTATASVQAQTTTSQNKGSASKLKGSKEEMPEESDSDHEGPIATQMLSFVMDDPDFESEESDSQRKKVGEFPVREDPSDISDEDTSLAKPPQPMKPTIHSFKLKNDSDLFGLGLEETGPKESSDEDKEKHPSKEKKKKKKSKEEEEKSIKKKSKHKKCREKEESKDEKKKKKKRSKEKNNEIDELEAFLGGGASASKQQGGGDYEEL